MPGVRSRAACKKCGGGLRLRQCTKQTVGRKWKLCCLRLLVLAVPQMRDYALLLGMPGTGKTTTIVHIIKVRRHVWMLL